MMVRKQEEKAQPPYLARRPTSALGAAVLGLQILAGHVEITYYMLMVAGSMPLWRLAGAVAAGCGPGGQSCGWPAGCWP